ncbi:MAG: hypothetical protein HKN26_12575 [Acidimicrobiales bacterium]|nr:hypothetical protein [Acidimicrobiales bacterium]
MTAAVIAPSCEAATPTPLRGLWKHGLIFLLLLAAVMATIDFDSSVTSDDGAYGWQVHALEDGTWPLERTLPVVAGENEGIINGSVGPDGPWAYTRHPGYVLAQRALADVFGFVLGMHLLSLVALVSLPFVVAAVAARVDPEMTVPAFWLAAVSPVMVNGSGLWAHAPAAVLAGVSLGAAIRLVQRPGLGASAVLAVSLVGGVLVRSEAVLWAGAITLAIVVVARDLPRLLYASSALVASAVAVVVERRIAADLVADALPIPAASDVPTRPSFLAGRIPAAWHELFSGTLGGGGLAGSLALIGLVLLVAGAVRCRRARFADARVLLVAGLAAYGARLLVLDGDLITGIVTAWPAVVVALIAVPVRLGPPLQVAATSASIFTLAVLATQYSSGSGDGWGGRYLSNAVPALCLLTAAAVLAAPRDRFMRGVAVGLLVLPLASGLLGAHQRRTLHEDSIDYVLQLQTDVVVTEVPALPRLAWADAGAAEWYRSTPDRLAPFLVELAEADVDRITVQGFPDRELGLAGYELVYVDAGLRQLVVQR